MRPQDTLKEQSLGTSLVVQWLGLYASTAGGMILIPGQGARFPQAAWFGQNKKVWVTYTGLEKCWRHSHQCLCAKLPQLCLTLCNPMDHNLPVDSPGKNTAVGCHFLLQGIFLTQESNPGLLPLLLW